MPHQRKDTTNRRGLAMRGLALFFVLFALADITAPELCGEELLGFPPLELLEVAQDRNALVGGALAPDGGDAPEAPVSADEDCFCCCSHLLVLASFVLEPEPLERVAPERLALVLPRGLDPTLYRPPRIG